MGNNDDFFTKAGAKIKDSSSIILIFFVSILMFVIGLNHMYEDILSSRHGLQWLSMAFGVIPVSLNITWWTMSAAPSIGQIVLVFLRLTLSEPAGGGKAYLEYEAKKKLFTWGAWFLFVLDNVSDIWYRSNEMASFESLLVGAGITLVWYNVMSELFVTMGFGLVTTLFPFFVVQWSRMTDKMIKSLLEAKRISRERKMRRNTSGNSSIPQNKGAQADRKIPPSRKTPPSKMSQFTNPPLHSYNQDHKNRTGAGGAFNPENPYHHLMENDSD
jgi:hypothetical protein